MVSGYLTRGAPITALLVAAAAFIVVYEGANEFPHMGNPRRAGETAAPRQKRPGFTDLCVFVGGSTNVYTDVPTVGFSP